MLRIHVRYILITVIATALYVVWINFGTPISLSEVLVPRHFQKPPTVPEKAHVIDPTKRATLRPTKCNYVIKDFDDIVISLTRALDFFDVFLTDLVVDAAVGTRILQGQLQLTLESISLPLEFKVQLEELLAKTTTISDRIVEHFVNTMRMNDQSPDGQERLKQNLNWIASGSLWEMPAVGDWQNDLSLNRYNVDDDDTVNFLETDFSDRCTGAVFDNCAVPDDCFTSFLGKRYSAYLITHAILFLLFSKKKNCFHNQEYMDKITQLGQPNDIFSSLCAKVFLEARAIENMGFRIDHRDLFTEQILVGSMSGFEQFLQRRWLSTIFSWQSKDLLGCFELPVHQRSQTFDEIYGIEKKHKRVKRYDYVITTGTQNCSTHFTGVSVGCIGIYLRHLVETCAETLFEST